MQFWEALSTDVTGFDSAKLDGRQEQALSRATCHFSKNLHAMRKAKLRSCPSPTYTHIHKV